MGRPLWESRFRPIRLLGLTGWLLAHTALAGGAAAQSLLHRTPNFNGVSVPSARSAEFAFLHRFELVGGEIEKLINYPTLVLGVGLPTGFGIGATYVSRSELGLSDPNEWELWAKREFTLSERAGFAATVAYNTAAESVDGEIAGLVRVSLVSLHGVLRGFSDAFASGESAAAAGGGLALHLTPRLALVADVARIVTTDTLPAAWSAGIHVAIPATPHTLGFVVSNLGPTTLQNASRGKEDEDGDANLRYGFAFTMPIGTFSQWARIFHGEEAAGPDEILVTIRDFAFGPTEIRVRTGETVRWVNEDPIAHTVTADDGRFDSGLLEEGEGFSRRFDEPGRYPYHCTPHPFMTGMVIVEAAEE